MLAEVLDERQRALGSDDAAGWKRIGYDEQVFHRLDGECKHAANWKRDSHQRVSAIGTGCMSDVSTQPRPASAPIGLRKLARGIVWNWSQFLISGVLAFLISPYVVHHLGSSAY